MKIFLLLSLLMASFTAFASVEDFLGIYNAKDGDGAAVVSRSLKTPKTPFNAAIYAYHVEIFRKKDGIDRFLNLRLNFDNTILIGRGSENCYFTDCHTLTSYNVELKKLNSSSQLTLVYEGYSFLEGVDAYNTFAGEIIFLKN